MDTLHFWKQNKSKRDKKMLRSDSCPRPCRFRDLASGRCAFETCLMEELPPTQVDPILVHCWVCGREYHVAVNSVFMDDRICRHCKLKIQMLVTLTTRPRLLYMEGLEGEGYVDKYIDDDEYHNDK